MPIPAWRRTAAVAALAAAAAASLDASAGVIRTKFTCDAGRTIAAEFVQSPQPLVRLALSDGRALTLPQAISASGARYASADDRIVFWNKSDTAFVEEGGKPTFTGCVVER
jgi:membrane-bound inhibitor of C-type lysozyme